MRPSGTASYKAEQAVRGEDIYNRTCSYCHRSDLSGGDDGAPALRGNPFFVRWKGPFLFGSLLVLAETMPQDAPSSLSRTDTPTSSASSSRRTTRRPARNELAADEERLKHIVLKEKPAP